MAREWFDYDPLTGVTEWYEERDGSISIHYEQDVEPLLDYCKALSNEGLPDKNFKGEGWLYAMIPPVVQGQMLKKGINFMDPNHTKAVIDEINANYPYLKTTHRHHALKR